MAKEKLYWTGNSAKAKVIGEVLQYVREHPDEEVVVFDYGCGKGGDWANILSDYPNIKLIGYDPLQGEIMAARAALKGKNAELLTGNELEGKAFKAHFIVSFSVFEHVYDRRAYLRTAKEHLAENGLFYLNYDDGHFRVSLDLDAPMTWPAQIRAWIHNLLATVLARGGWVSQFQKRVNRAEVDTLVTEMGFKVTRVFYSNLGSLKGLYKTLSQERQQDFARLWIELEDALNAHFLEEGPTQYGDAANLWQFMGARTLVLTL